jgi:hypothetical protein
LLDAHRDDGKRFVVRADEKLTAFMELEAAILRLRQIALTVAAILGGAFFPLFHSFDYFR